MQNPSKYWSVKEVAEYLGMKVQTIYNMVHAGKIPFYKIGLKSVRFNKKEIDAWIKNREKVASRKDALVIKDGYPHGSPDEKKAKEMDARKLCRAVWRLHRKDKSVLALRAFMLASALFPVEMANVILSDGG